MGLILKRSTFLKTSTENCMILHKNLFLSKRDCNTLNQQQNLLQIYQTGPNLTQEYIFFQIRHREVFW